MNPRKRKITVTEPQEIFQPLKKNKVSDLLNLSLLSREVNLEDLPLLFLDQICNTVPILYYKTLARVNRRFYGIFYDWMFKQKTRLIGELHVRPDINLNPFVKGFILERKFLDYCITADYHPVFMRSLKIRQCQLCRVWPKWIISRSWPESSQVLNEWCLRCIARHNILDVYKKCNGEGCNISNHVIYTTCDSCRRDYCYGCSMTHIREYYHKTNLGHSLKYDGIRTKLFCIQCIEMKNRNNVWINSTEYNKTNP
jgi:hypothetical protein